MCDSDNNANIYSVFIERMLYNLKMFYFASGAIRGVCLAANSGRLLHMEVCSPNRRIMAILPIYDLPFSVFCEFESNANS